MIKFSILLIVAVATICSARYLPKKEFVKQTSQEWTETAKKIGLNDEQTTAVVDLMQFIQDHDIDSAEMDTNTEWKESMLEKCKKLADSDKINELNELVGEKKWSEVKDKDISEKLDFWNDKYMTWKCEEGKMKAIKNMCILVSEDTHKKKYLDRANRAGLKDDQLKPMADLLWDMKVSKKIGEAKAKLADRCEILGSDDNMLEIDEKHMANMKWSDMADKNISMKMEFWWNVTKESDCKIAKMKAIINLCVEFMCPVERKKIEDLAKEAGIIDEDVPAVVDMEMRMNFAQGTREQSNMLMESFERLGKNQMIMEVPLTEKQKETLKTLETTIDFVPKVHFWAFKYYEDNGVNHIKSLKNMCSVMVKEKQTYAEREKKMRESPAAQSQFNQCKA